MHFEDLTTSIDKCSKEESVAANNSCVLIQQEETLTNNPFFSDLLKECDSYIHSSKSFVSRAVELSKKKSIEAESHIS